MTTRRSFIQGAATTLGVMFAGTSLPSAASLLGTGRSGSYPLHSVIYEPEYLASAQFGEHAKAIGHLTHAIDGDVTALWTRHLCAQWRKKPVAIAGMTDANALFVLERFAWDNGLRVVFRSEHQPQNDGSIKHILTGPGAMLNALEALAANQASYASSMARIIGQQPVQPAPVLTKTILTAGMEVTPPSHTMHTWVIAPHKRLT